jgi:flagellar basal body-associated protein FliL
MWIIIPIDYKNSLLIHHIKDRDKKQVQTGVLESMAEELKNPPQGESMAASDTTADSPPESKPHDAGSAEQEKAAVAPATSDTKSIEPPDETFWESSVDASAVNLADAGTAQEERGEESAAEGTPASGDAPTAGSEENTTGGDREEASPDETAAEEQSVSAESEATREQNAPAGEDLDQLTAGDKPQQVKDSDKESVAEKKEAAAAGGEERQAEVTAEGENSEPQEDGQELLAEAEPEGEASAQEKIADQETSEAKEPEVEKEEVQQEEEAVAAADAAEAEGKVIKLHWRPSRKAVLIAAGIVLLIMGSIGFSVVVDTRLSDTVTSTFLKKQPENAYDMKFFLPLNVGYEKARFVKVTIAIELMDKGFKKEIDENVSRLRKEVIDLLLTKSPEEVKSSQGKKLLRQEITSRLNHCLAKDCIKDTYFTELVIL